MRQLTARRLVAEQLGHRHLSRPRVSRAVARMQAAGWTLAYHPRSDEPERLVVAVRYEHPMSPLLRLTFFSSVTYGRTRRVERQMVEQRVGDLHNWEAGRMLGRHGLLMLALEDQWVHLFGIDPLLATTVNRLRYGGSRKGRDHAHLLQAALGLPRPPRWLGAVSDETLLKAALIYEELGVDAGGLLERRARSHPQSRWLIAQPTFACSNGRGQA